jgi:hypothetical protein
MLSAKNLFLVATIAGGALLLLSIAMTRAYPSTVPNLPPEFTSAVLALEFSGSLAEVDALFDGDRGTIMQFHRGHYVDMVYLGVYTVFLAGANLAYWRLQGRLSGLLGMLAAVGAGIADCAENLLLMQVTDALLHQAAAPSFLLLRVLVSSKFVLIGIAMLSLVPSLWRQHSLGKIYSLATAAMIAATTLTLAGYYVASSAMMLATAVAWLALWLVVLQCYKGFRLSTHEA